jgi:thiosulfate dehydrogenase (quinone) large subunit
MTDQATGQRIGRFEQPIQGRISKLQSALRQTARASRRGAISMTTSHRPERIRARTEPEMQPAAPAQTLLPSAGIRRAARALRRALDDDAQREQALLVPLRGFIGLGWLRAGVEKLVAPGWFDGSALTSFLAEQLNGGHVVFPLYASAIYELFLPQAQAMSWIVLLGQLLAGLAILLGGFTRAALLGGLFMNVNFLLAGVPNPSAFYIVIQMLLLVGNAGSVFGLDRWLAPAMPRLLLAVLPAFLHFRRDHLRHALHILGGLLLATAICAATYITDYSPAGSVEDPAAIVVVMALLGIAWATLLSLRIGLGEETLRRR